MNSPQRRFKLIRDHFEAEARNFDAYFLKIAPTYLEAIRAIASALPFKEDRTLKILDLGCGTGNITQALKTRYPRSHITCIDLAKNMLALAKTKLKKYKNISYWNGDIRDFDYSQRFDAVVGSLVLHHVEETEKKSYYKKLFGCLNKNGVFYNADVFLGATRHIQDVYMRNWIDFLKKSLTPGQIRKTLQNHRREDRPCRLMTELDFLREAGFRDVDVLWKNYYFAVYGGVRRSP
ncbi:MAG TPA: methyltransferase domain-containing protein [Elusimicrobiota bacterium]|nr:methyltransferase domain-containing protein [Elusimicrobiota bacterium]